ncbi:transcriptional regulator, TetR family [Marinobacter daqiaonensis]|uniref:Transcriptional regulator, TetR family n=1 Tax=Marinobacter daqiaonensis TaxID=650891 RepID=A0A1I6JRY4_9GAMM|nr:TetR/AcrR family transcriptional regulator [Marinobacter daqiaonensis]SFR81737.1 transcriptional regulator, TetR family [Marinobacter daqiaonensis]
MSVTPYHRPRNTRLRILEAGLELFNQRGERNVTTNHIASALGMSPGNLYYHFGNKSEIVYELFLAYESLVDSYLVVKPGRALGTRDLVFYLESVVEGLWKYRFLHRDLEFLLESDPRLRREYRAFTGRCLVAIERVLAGLELGAVLQPLSRELRQALALNIWLVITNWMAFLKTAHEEREPANAEVRQGIYQVLTLHVPYLAESHRDEVLALRESYRPDLLPPLGDAIQ